MKANQESRSFNSGTISIAIEFVTISLVDCPYSVTEVRGLIFAWLNGHLRATHGLN